MTPYSYPGDPGTRPYYFLYSGVSSTTVTLTFPAGSVGSTTIYLPPPRTNLRAERLKLLFRWNRQAVQTAQEALRAGVADARGPLAGRPCRGPSERLHDVPRVKGRVCAGSNRYRVAW